MASTSNRIATLKRPRAHELDAGPVDPAIRDLFEGPDNWVNLRKMVMTGTWRKQAQRSILEHSDSQRNMEDTSTHIHTAGKLAFINANRQYLDKFIYCRAAL